MARLSHLLITLPLVAAPVWALGLKPAAAATATPIEALELLARGSALAAKCKAAASSERDELNGYLAKAEIATTARYSVDDAKMAIALGRKSADVTACGPSAASDVQSTLNAARDAMAEAASRSSSRQAKRIVALKPREPVRKAIPETRVIPEMRGSNGLKAYANRAMAYYVERRCRHLSRSETKTFWERVVSSYEDAVSAHGAAAVARAQRRAETDAGRWTCGERSNRLVETAYLQGRSF